MITIRPRAREHAGPHEQAERPRVSPSADRSIAAVLAVLDLADEDCALEDLFAAARARSVPVGRPKVTRWAMWIERLRRGVRRENA